MRPVLLLTAVLLAACTCERLKQPTATKRDAGRVSRPTVKTRPPDSRTWFVGMKPVMAKLTHLAGEVSRRLARPNFPIADAAKVLDRVVPEIPNYPEPAFSSWKNTLKERTAALRDSKNGKKDFGQVVEACIGCHVRYAPASLPQVQALRAAEAPAPPKK